MNKQETIEEINRLCKSLCAYEGIDRKAVYSYASVDYRDCFDFYADSEEGLVVKRAGVEFEDGIYYGNHNALKELKETIEKQESLASKEHHVLTRIKHMSNELLESFLEILSENLDLEVTEDIYDWFLGEYKKVQDETSRAAILFALDSSVQQALKMRSLK